MPGPTTRRAAARTSASTAPSTPSSCRCARCAISSTPRLVQAPAAFEAGRHRYNHERPHEALGQDRPASRYTPSPRSMPGRAPEPDYDADTPVRRVSTTKGYIRFKGQARRVPDAFRGERLAIRPTATDGRYAVCFGARPIATIDLTRPIPVSDLSEHPSTMSPG